MNARVGAALAIALGIGACASQSREIRTASVTMMHGVAAAPYAGADGIIRVKSQRCLLSAGDRSTVLAALGGVVPVDSQLGDDGRPEAPTAGSGLLFVFGGRSGPALAVTVPDWPPRGVAGEVHIRVNGRVARISPDGLISIQEVAARRGCLPLPRQRTSS